MRDRLIRLIAEANQKSIEAKPWTPRQAIEIITDHLLANGVIVPPCKVGDTLWVRWSLSEGHKKDIYPVKVYALRFDTKKNNMRVCVEGHFKITAYGGSYTHYYNGTFAWNSVGKTVFLTKEEAEKALAERSGE
jgi:hypothetical protein